MELPKNFYNIVQLEDDILLYRSDLETASAIKIDCKAENNIMDNELKLQKKLMFY